MALFRVYENGRPIDSRDYLKWNAKGAADQDLVFVSGHPGSTSRLDTMAQLEYQRDVNEPVIIKLLQSRIATLEKYSAQGAEQALQAASLIFNLQNSLKAYQGMHGGLLDKNIMAKKEKDEAEFKARVMANPAWKAAYGGAWDAIAEAEKTLAERTTGRFYHGMDSQLATRRHGHRAVRGGSEEAGWRAAARLPRRAARVAEVSALFARAHLSGPGDCAHHRLRWSGTWPGRGRTTRF